MFLSKITKSDYPTFSNIMWGLLCLHCIRLGKVTFNILPYGVFFPEPYHEILGVKFWLLFYRSKSYSLHVHSIKDILWRRKIVKF